MWHILCSVLLAACAVGEFKSTENSENPLLTTTKCEQCGKAELRDKNCAKDERETSVLRATERENNCTARHIRRHVVIRRRCLR